MDELKAKQAEWLREQIKSAQRQISFSVNSHDIVKIPVWERLITGYRADLMKLMQQEENGNG